MAEQDGSTVTYGYDGLYRLTSDTRTGTNASSHAYGYDLAGNLYDGQRQHVCHYDTANKISSLTGGNVSYDADGNVTTDQEPGCRPARSGGTTTAGRFSRSRRHNAQLRLPNAGGLRTWSQVGSGTKTFYLFAGSTLPLGEIQAGSSIPSVAYTPGARTGWSHNGASVQTAACGMRMDRRARHGNSPTTPERLSILMPTRPMGCRLPAWAAT